MRLSGRPSPPPHPHPRRGRGKKQGEGAAAGPRGLGAAAGPGAPRRGRPGRGRREAAGLLLPSPARSLRPVPTAAARIPAPGWSFRRSKFTLFGCVPRLLAAEEIRQLGVTAGLRSLTVPYSHASGSAQTSGLRAASRHRVERAGRAAPAPACPLPFATFPPPGGGREEGAWAEPGRSARRRAGQAERSPGAATGAGGGRRRGEGQPRAASAPAGQGRQLAVQQVLAQTGGVAGLATDGTQTAPARNAAGEAPGLLSTGRPPPQRKIRLDGEWCWEKKWGRTSCRSPSSPSPCGRDSSLTSQGIPIPKGLGQHPWPEFLDRRKKAN